MTKAYNYKKNTKVQVLENVSANIDKVKVIRTNLIRYMYVDNEVNTKNSVTSTNTLTNSVSNKTYTLKNNTKLFVNLDLTKRIQLQKRY